MPKNIVHMGELELFLTNRPSQPLMCVFNISPVFPVPGHLDSGFCDGHV